MEDKEIIAYRNSKPHTDQAVLTDLWNKHQSIKAIANHLHISKKLVEIKMKEYGIQK